MPIKKTAPKKVLKKKAPGHQHDERKVAANLKIARDIMEHKVEGFLLIAKLTDEPKGFKMEGAAIVNSVSGEKIARVVMQTLELTPLDFILAEFKQGDVTDLNKKPKKRK